MKESIKRNDLKTNFLKQSIIRIDYDYLFEGNLEKILEEMYHIIVQVVQQKYLNYCQIFLLYLILLLQYIEKAIYQIKRY